MCVCGARFYHFPLRVVRGSSPFRDLDRGPQIGSDTNRLHPPFLLMHDVIMNDVLIHYVFMNVVFMNVVLLMAC